MFGLMLMQTKYHRAIRGIGSTVNRLVWFFFGSHFQRAHGGFYNNVTILKNCHGHDLTVCISCSSFLYLYLFRI